MVVVKGAKDKDKEDPIEGVGHIIANECDKINLVKGTYKAHTDVNRARSFPQCNNY